jgi:hypothetical protein
MNVFLFIKSMSAILFTDITKSSRLWKISPKGMVSALREHDMRIKKKADKFDGVIIKGMGDSFMIHFKKPINAFIFSFELQKSFIAKPIKVSNKTMEIRIGIGIGKMNKKKMKIQGYDLVDYFGNTVNIGSRMESKVSPARGFAFHFQGNKVPKKIMEYIKENARIIKKIHYKNKCPDPKSVKLLAAECRLSESLHGVGELTAYAVYV